MNSVQQIIQQFLGFIADDPYSALLCVGFAH